MKCANETRTFPGITYDTLYGMRLGRAAFAIAVGCAAVTACLFPSLDDLEGGKEADSSTDGGAEGSPTDGPMPDTSVPLSDLDCDAAVAVWPFDEGEGGTVNDCKKLYPGSLDNGCSWTTGPDGGGHAVAFDGGLISFQSAPMALRVGGSDEAIASFTAMAHIYARNPGSGNIKFIMGRLMNGPDGYAWGIGLFYAMDNVSDHATLGVRYPTLDGGDLQSAFFILSDTARWFHIAVTFDAPTSLFTFYVEGSPKSTAKAAADWKPRNSGLEIGGIDSNVTQGLGGAMRDVRLYDRALSDQDIAAIMAEK